MRQWDHGGGFSLNAAVRIEAADRKGLESQGQGWSCWARRGCNACSVIAPALSSQASGWSGRSGASAQSAAEAAIKLHPDVKDRLADIGKIVLASQKPALRIIDKQGRLANPADRDHCLQYVVAIGLLFGELHYHHFEDEVAADPRIDAKSHFLSSPVLATPVGSRYLFPFLVAFEVAPKEEGGDLFFQYRQL